MGDQAGVANPEEPKTPAIQQQFQLTAEGVAEIIVAAMGQNGIQANAVYFQGDETGLKGATVVCDAHSFQLRCVPEEKGSIAQRHREYLQGITAMLMPKAELPEEQGAGQ